jgi:prepilin-type N-terminal cleavage/methylation domain-containing protein
MNKNKAFTLIELLVVIAIVGILSSVIYSNITGIRDRARITAGIRFDSSTLHSIGDQLVGEWTFDTPNLPLIDTSGFGNVGTCTACPTYATTSGYNNKGVYSFDGINDGINVLNSSIISGVKTVSVWAYPYTTQKTYATIVSKADYSAPYIYGWVIRCSGSANNWYANVGSTLGHMQILLGNIQNAWHNIVLTYDGTTMKVYLDGVFKGQGNIGYTEAVLNLRIGWGSVNPSDSYFNGLIDDVRIYTSALSSSEIQKLYAEGKDRHQMSLH